ncbi:MAG: hypothetical protein Q8R18_02935 [bacterium]|nr:hypothetical protein [bacterium]
MAQTIIPQKGPLFASKNDSVAEKSFLQRVFSHKKILILIFVLVIVALIFYIFMTNYAAQLGEKTSLLFVIPSLGSSEK